MHRQRIPYLFAAGVVAGCLIATHAHADERDCPVGTFKTGERREETATQIIVRNVCKRMTREQLEAELKRVDAAAAATRASIETWRTKNFPELASQFEFWENVGKDTRKDVVLGAAQMVMSWMMQRELAALGNRKVTLTLKERDAFAALLDKWGARIPEAVLKSHGDLVKTLRRAESLNDMLEGLDKLIGGTQFAYQQAGIAKQAKQGEHEEALLALAGQALGLIVDRVPTWKLAHSMSDYGVTLIFANATLAQGVDAVSRLGEITEAELKNVGVLAKRYTTLVDEKRELTRLKHQAK